MGAILFIAFLTLKAWDIGGGGRRTPRSRGGSPRLHLDSAAHVLAVTLLRIAVFRHRWFIFSAAVLLQAVLTAWSDSRISRRVQSRRPWQRWRSVIRRLRSGRSTAPGGGAREESAHHTAAGCVHPRAGRRGGGRREDSVHAVAGAARAALRQRRRWRSADRSRRRRVLRGTARAGQGVLQRGGRKRSS